MAKKKEEKAVPILEEQQKISSEQEEQRAMEQQEALLKALNDSYLTKLDDEMGKLHNQFAAFISVAGIPLPQVLLVLEILVKETIEQAYQRYLGGK